MMAAGRFAEAAAIYSELVQAHPNDAGLQTNLGMAYHLAGKDREAVRHFETALKQQDGIIPAMVMLGASYLRLGEPAKAIAPLRKAAAAAPEIREARQMLANALAALGRHEEAAEQFRRWTALDASDPRAWLGLGRTYEALAQETFRQLEKSAPESAYMLALVAAAQLSREQYRSAFYLYREALQRQPGLRGVHLALADIYRKTGHPDWAEQEAARERNLAGADCSSRSQECDFLAGRHQQAAEIGKGTPAPEAYYWRVRALNELAREAFARLEKLPESVEGHAVKATIQRERGLYGESIQQWQQALKLSPGNPELERELAITLRMNEDYDAARPLLEKLLKRNPRSGELNYLLGQVLLNQQHPAEAVPYLAKAVELEPGFLPARSSLGLAYLQLNQEREAIAELRAALPLDTDGSLHFRLARAYQKLGQPELAREALARFQELQAGADARRKAAEQQSQITPP